MSKIYYIDNSKTVSQDFLPKGITCLSPADFLVAERDEADQLVVLCEIDINTKNETVNRTDFYGISFVQKLRRKNYKNKVLFVSFLPESYYKEKVLNAKILFFRGHDFIQLPLNPEEWRIAFENIADIDSLSLYDMQQHVCNRSGILKESVHRLRSHIPPDDSISTDFKKECKKLYSQFCEGKSLSTDDFSNAQELLDHVKNQCNATLPAEEQQEFVIIKPKWKWKVLWLDDEIELDGNNKLLAQLQARNITVDFARTYAEAMHKWGDDLRKTQEYSIIIADYRLGDGNQIKEKQGYHFLKEIATQATGVGVMVYSSLTRNFLIQSFKHYGIQLSIFSKLDFSHRNVNHAKYLADEIRVLGDEHWELRNNQPTSINWENILPVYLHLKDLPKFYTVQQYISKKTRQNLDEFIERFRACTDKFDLWNLRFADTIERQTTKISSGAINNGKISNVEKILLIRRLAIGLYAYLLSNKNKNTILSSDQYLQYVKAILYCSSGQTLSDVKSGVTVDRLNIDDSLEKILNDSKLKQNLSYCGLTLEELWPLGLLPEEYAWLSYDSGLAVNYHNEIESYFRFLHKIKPLIKTCFENSAYFQSKLTDGNIQISKGKTILINDDFEPLIRSADDIKEVFKWLREQLIDSPSLGVDFPVYIALWRACMQALKSFSKGSLLHKEMSSIIHFMNTTLKPIDKECARKIKGKWCDALDVMKGDESWSDEDIALYKRLMQRRTNFTIEEEYVHLHNPTDLYYGTAARVGLNYRAKLENINQKFNSILESEHGELTEAFYQHISELDIEPFTYVIKHKTENLAENKQIIYQSIVACKIKNNNAISQETSTSSVDASSIENPYDIFYGEEDANFVSLDEISLEDVADPDSTDF